MVVDSVFKQIEENKVGDVHHSLELLTLLCKIPLVAAFWDSSLKSANQRLSVGYKGVDLVLYIQKGEGKPLHTPFYAKNIIPFISGLTDKSPTDVIDILLNALRENDDKGINLLWKMIHESTRQIGSKNFTDEIKTYLENIFDGLRKRNTKDLSFALILTNAHDGQSSKMRKAPFVSYLCGLTISHNPREQ